jgi:hypothetical protein
MGKLTPTYKKAMFDELVDAIYGNTSQYYAFASHPVPLPPNTSPSGVTNDDYSVDFLNNWYMLFGKRLQAKDFAAVVFKNLWTPGQVWDRYDNQSQTVLSRNRFYVLAPPTDPEGDFYYYKCIDNNEGDPLRPSTKNPASIGTPMQPTTFTTVDGYRWRYIAKISVDDFGKFATQDYAPIFPDPIIVADSMSYSCIDKIVLANSGVGYETWSKGVVESITNTSVIEIANSAYNRSQYYVNNSIYFNNPTSSTGQIFGIKDYYIQQNRKFVVLDGSANTDNISPGTTQYYIGPKVVLESDGKVPVGYAVVNADSKANNSISHIEILDPGSAISWCNVHIESNTNYGYGANVYAIAPPPGGHGANPAVELNMSGYGINITFINSEGNTIPTEGVLYNKVGIIKDPCALTNVATKGVFYNNETFNQILVANVSYTFERGQTIFGANTGSRGYVVFANSTQVWLAGDKTFKEGETLKNANNTLQGKINSIVQLGDIYTKDLTPLYAQNINNIERTKTQSESYKLVLKI